MPIEYLLLKNAPVPLSVCPKCGERFEPFLRGMVQRGGGWRFWRKRPTCALICWACKEIVGYEWAPYGPPALGETPP
jgi:hypothetical protein